MFQHILTVIIWVSNNTKRAVIQPSGRGRCSFWLLSRLIKPWLWIIYIRDCYVVRILDIDFNWLCSSFLWVKLPVSCFCFYKTSLCFYLSVRIERSWLKKKEIFILFFPTFSFFSVTRWSWCHFLRLLNRPSFLLQLKVFSSIWSEGLKETKSNLKEF